MQLLSTTGLTVLLVVGGAQESGAHKTIENPSEIAVSRGGGYTPADPTDVELETFKADGTQLTTSAAPALSEGHGVFLPIAANQYQSTVLLLERDSDGHFTGTVRVRSAISLDAAGESFSERRIVESFDPSGHVLSRSTENRAASRIGVVPME